MAITFQSTNITFNLPEKNKLKRWLKQLAAKHKKQIGELNYVFTNDETLLHYNQQFLNHQSYTDIITFDTSSNNFIAGDIIISIERVSENALKFAVPVSEELHRVVAHGLLHLLGFKDKKKSDIMQMRAQEALALKLFHKLA